MNSNTDNINTNNIIKIQLTGLMELHNFVTTHEMVEDNYTLEKLIIECVNLNYISVSNFLNKNKNFKNNTNFNLIEVDKKLREFLAN